MNNNADNSVNEQQVCLNKQCPVFDTARKHRAGALVRINLSPLMGRRDAVLDAAENLIDAVDDFAAEERITAFAYLNRLFSAAANNSSRISGMFNNNDTMAREQRLSIHIGILSDIARSLDEFSTLCQRMHAAAALYADDPNSEFDEISAAETDIRMSIAADNLLTQLKEYFSRVRARISRYRLYAVKNFSPENLERYQKSYLSVASRCDAAFEKFSVKISTLKTRSFFNEKLSD